MRTTRRLIAATLWGVQLSLWMAVPLLDVGLYQSGVSICQHGERSGDYRDHDHWICIQYFTNQAASASPPALALHPLVGTMPDPADPWSPPTLASPPTSARDPPLL